MNPGQPSVACRHQAGWHLNLSGSAFANRLAAAAAVTIQHAPSIHSTRFRIESPVIAGAVYIPEGPQTIKLPDPNRYIESNDLQGFKIKERWILRPIQNTSCHTVMEEPGASGESDLLHENAHRWQRDPASDLHRNEPMEKL
jgi:hypothetical protein